MGEFFSGAGGVAIGRRLLWGEAREAVNGFGGFVNGFGWVRFLGCFVHGKGLSGFVLYSSFHDLPGGCGGGDRGLNGIL